MNLKLISLLLAAFESQRTDAVGDFEELQAILPLPPFESLFYPYPILGRLRVAATKEPGFIELVNQHLSYMGDLGLIQRATGPGGTAEWPLNEWRLSNVEEIRGEMRERYAGKDRAGAEDRSANRESAIPVRGQGANDGGSGVGGNDGNDGNGRGPGAPGDGPAGPGDGGGGVRQVLGHPVLFALPSEEFDDVVGRLFDGAGVL